uniref:DDE_Tnp_1_7 domain-containing protein n=1 Tax=Heterorhabditis bacteriophora TaxID=37862 RepID=A0A1I7WS49_HETBA
MSAISTDETNPMRLAKKAWNHLGLFTRQEAIEWCFAIHSFLSQCIAFGAVLANVIVLIAHFMRATHLLCCFTRSLVYEKEITVAWQALEAASDPCDLRHTNCVSWLNRTMDAKYLLSEKLVSQKRRVLMKDCVRIIYYCHVQRSSGCRYEMSVCVPKDSEEKLRIDDFNTHTCNPDESRLKRRAKPQLEDFDKPIEKRKTAAQLNAAKEESIVYSLGDSMASFFHGLSDQQFVDGEIDMEHDSFSHTDVNLPTSSSSANDDLARFISQIGDTSKRASIISQSSHLRVWNTVDIDVVDFSKRPDGPFTYVFHAKDEASQYTYAYPMVSNQPEVVGEALLIMLFQFGSPDAIKLDQIYRGTQLESMVTEKFPEVHILYYIPNRNKQGMVMTRREETMIKERIFAWLMENGKLGWVKHLNEIKHAHNSEWIDELDGTPMERFFGRTRQAENLRKRKHDTIDGREDDSLSDTYTTNSNDLREDFSLSSGIVKAED